MHKLAALALTAVLGVVGMAYAKQAEARVYVGVGIGLPGVTLAPPIAYAPGLYAPYYYGRPYYYGPGFRYGYGYRGYGFHGYAYGRRWR